MTAATNDYGFSKCVRIRFWRIEQIVKPRNFMMKQRFSAISLRREWIQRVRELVVKLRELRNTLGRQTAYWCIVWRR